MAAQLVIGSVNGRPTHSIEFFGPSREPTLTIILQRVDLTPGEAGLRPDHIVRLYEGGIRDAQKKGDGIT